MNSKIEYLSRLAFNFSAFLILIITFLVFEQALARYLWSGSSVGMQELSWYLFGYAIFFSVAYCLKHDKHVRVDLFYSKFTTSRQNLIDALSHVLLIWPVCIIAIYFGCLYTFDAFSFTGTTSYFILAGEASPDPGGLPARWIARAAIPIGFVLLLIQSISIFFEKVENIKKGS